MEKTGRIYTAFPTDSDFFLWWTIHQEALWLGLLFVYLLLCLLLLFDRDHAQLLVPSESRPTATWQSVSTCKQCESEVKEGRCPRPNITVLLMCDARGGFVPIGPCSAINYQKKKMKRKKQRARQKSCLRVKKLKSFQPC